MSIGFRLKEMEEDADNQESLFGRSSGRYLTQLVIMYISERKRISSYVQRIIVSYLSDRKAEHRTKYEILKT